MGFLGMTLSIAACGNKEDSSTDAPEETTEATTEATTELTTEEITTEEETIKTIGKQEKDAYEIQISNETGKEIQEILIKTSEEEDYSENLLSANDIFEIDEERILYYKGDDSGDIEYDIQIVFKDGDTVELHALSFDDFTECKICLEDEVAFLTYESVSDGTVISTKEAELAIAEKANSSDSGDYPYTTLPLPAGEYPVTTVPSTQAPATEAPAPQQPATEAPAPQQPATEAPASNPDAGCLDDGLFY